MTGRDGFTISLWQGTASWQSKTKMPASERYDAIVVGGGITGLSLALQLQNAGKNTLLLEAKNLCFGTTGGTTAHINNFFDTPYSTIRADFSAGRAQKIADAANAAIDLISSNIESYTIDCAYQETDAYIYAEDETQEKTFNEIFESCKEFGLDVEETNSLPAPHEFHRVMRIGGQAKFHPTRYAFGLADAFENAGGKILENCRVTNVIEDDDGSISVETELGIFKAADLIYATHTLPGINLLHLRLVPYRSYAIAFELEDGNYPDILYYDLQEPYHYFRAQEIDGKYYLIAGGKDHRTGEEENTEQNFSLLETKIRSDYPVKKIAYKWSSQYYEPADGIPYIGALPGFSNHIHVATGYGGNGMTYSAIAAIILTDLITQSESPRIDPDLFNPSRIKPVAGFTEFVTHNAHVAANFIAKLFPPDKLASLSELAPGEGRELQYDDQRLGVYKSEKGQLYALSTTCTHMKCSVKWNSAEKSWDCPCHGARFSFTGEVLNAPADHGLERIDINEASSKSST